jgi:hypothetical protein
LPNGFSLPAPSLAGLIVPGDTGCEFGTCGISIGFQDPEYVTYRKKVLAAGDIPLDEAAWNIIFRHHKTWTAAAQVAHPCTIAGFFVASAAAPLLVSTTSVGAGAFPETASAMNLWAARFASQIQWIQKGAMQGARAAVFWVAGKFSSTCDSIAR